MNGNKKRPPIPSRFPVDESSQEARHICTLLNTAIKRAQREGPVDDMRLTLNQVIRAIPSAEPGNADESKLNAWKDALQQLEACYEYIKDKQPPCSSDPTQPSSWSNSWSGRDDNGIV